MFYNCLFSASIFITFLIAFWTASFHQPYDRVIPEVSIGRREMICVRNRTFLMMGDNTLFLREAIAVP